MAARGARVTLVARRREALGELATEIGGDARVDPADLSKLEDVEALAARLLAAAGPPDVLVNNAGAAHRAGLPVHVWTINDEATIHELLDLGVDGIMSDRLRLLRDTFARRGLQITGTDAGRGGPSSR